MRKLRRHKKKPYISAVTGENLPSVTTILGSVLAKGEGFYKWMYNQGKNGIPYGKSSGDAADIGTIAHYYIECFVLGKKAKINEKDYKEEHILHARKMFMMFHKYWYKREARLILSEKPVIDEELKFGGTIDIIVNCKHKDTRRDEIWDYKSSKSIWAEQIIQTAAYRQLALRVEKIDAYPRIVNISKELVFNAPDISQEDLDNATIVWYNLLQLYSPLKLLKKSING